MYEKVIKQLAQLILQEYLSEQVKSSGIPKNAFGFITVTKLNNSFTEELERRYEEMKKNGITFANKVYKHIDAQKRKDVDVYKSANITRSVWSDMKKDDYKPTKQTALKLAVALNLNYDDAEDLLNCAGYSLKGMDDYKLMGKIIELKDQIADEGEYSIASVNEILNYYKQKTLE